MAARGTAREATDGLDSERVADLLEVLHVANGLMGAEIDRLLGSRASVSPATVECLGRLAAELRPGAAAKARLAAIDLEVLLAGARVWHDRLRVGPDCASSRGAARRANGSPA